jgi:hypothetical protein
MASGIAEGGESPRMTIDSKCHSDEDLNRLETVWVPLGDVVKNPVKDGNIEFADENTVRLHFENMPDSWPETWVMWSVRFYREDGSTQPLVIDAGQLRRAETRRMSFDWKATP